MSFPAHVNYKDSGIEWLGKLPSHWSLVRFKTIFCERDDRSETGDEELLSVSAYTGVSPRSQIIGDGDHLSRAESLVGYKRCYPNDLVMNIMLAWNRGLGFTRHAGIVSPSYCVFAPLSGILPSFADYLVRSNEYTAYFKSFSSGVIDSRLRLYPDEFGALFCALPPHEEQQAIATFLDGETAKIDALVEEQRHLVALLKEKRRAVISRAVTKGLNPDVPMKDTGIDWLDEVPAHWLILPLRRVVRRFVDYRGATPTKVDEGVPLITATQIKNGKVDHSLDPVFISEDEYAERMTRGFPTIGDLLLTTEAPLGEVALITDERVAPGQRIILMKMNERILSRYLLAHFQSIFGQDELWTRASGSTASGIRADRLRSSNVLVPPVGEQQEIIEFIEKKTAAFEEIKRTAEKAIKLLHERRSALISAAVNGKIDVRDSSNVIPFPVNRAQIRGLVATEIIERSANQKTFGRVKFQKLAFLADKHVGIEELAGSYEREAAGPLDWQMIEEMEREAGKIAGITVLQPNGVTTTVSYRLGAKTGFHSDDLAQAIGSERSVALRKLLSDFSGLTTHAAEAVATLYAIWNDGLIEGHELTDNQIAEGFLNDWHAEKRIKFKTDELQTWLGWMRRNGYVPSGRGPPTNYQRALV